LQVQQDRHIVTVHEGRSVKPVVTCALIGIVAVAALAAGTGFATTPGVNGLIAYSGQHQLFTIRADGTRKRQLTQTAVQAQAVHADWSPNGTRIVFGLERKDGAGIAVMSADGSGARVLTPRGFQGQPSFSPDGKWIVYERNIADGNNGVWLMRANATDLRRVTRSPFGCCDTDPNFSPDGKTISFVRIKAHHKLQAIFSVRRDGSGLRQVTPYAWEVGIKHDWSPDGKLILLTTNADFARPRESANLVTIRPDGSGVTKLTRFTRGTKNAFAGSFSPDGKQIVFRLETGNQYGLAIINRDGSSLRRLTTSANQPRYIDWGTHP
jgi:Tol biopolymer transport system component